MIALLDQIESYLNGSCSYEHAATIFLMHGNKKTLAQRLLARKNDRNEEKLRYELEKIAETLRETPTETTIEAPINIGAIRESINIRVETHQKNQSIDHFIESRNTDLSVDFSLKNLISIIETDRKKLYKSRGFTHAQLSHASSDQERYEIAHKIQQIQDDIDQIERDYEDAKAGNVPEAYARTFLTADQYKEIENVKAYIRRYKNKISKANSVDEKQHLEAMLKKQETKLDQLYGRTSKTPNQT